MTEEQSVTGKAHFAILDLSGLSIGIHSDRRAWHCDGWLWPQLFKRIVVANRYSPLRGMRYGHYASLYTIIHPGVL